MVGADVVLVPINCIHDNNPASSDDLCELWCQIQIHGGSECIICPSKYDDEPEKEFGPTYNSIKKQ